MFERIKQIIMKAGMGIALNHVQTNYEVIEVRRRASIPEDGTLDPATPITYEFYQDVGNKGTMAKLGEYNPDVAIESEAVLNGGEMVVRDAALRQRVLDGLIRETRAAAVDKTATAEIRDKKGSPVLGYKKIS